MTSFPSSSASHHHPSNNTTTRTRTTTSPSTTIIQHLYASILYHTYDIMIHYTDTIGKIYHKCGSVIRKITDGILLWNPFGVVVVVLRGRSDESTGADAADDDANSNNNTAAGGSTKILRHLCLIFDPFLFETEPRQKKASSSSSSSSSTAISSSSACTSPESLSDTNHSNTMSHILHLIDWTMSFDTIDTLTLYDIKGQLLHLFRDSGVGVGDISSNNEEFLRHFRWIKDEELPGGGRDGSSSSASSSSTITGTPQSMHLLYKNHLHVHIHSFSTLSTPNVVNFVKDYYRREKERIHEVSREVMSSSSSLSSSSSWSGIGNADLALSEQSLQKQRDLYHDIGQEMTRYSHNVISREPDLTIILGKVPILHGYNPLFLRYTEIFHHQAGLDIQREDLERFVRQFEGVQHRYGK